MTAVSQGWSNTIVARLSSTTPPATSLAATSLTGLGKENSDSRIAPSDYEEAALVRGLLVSGAEGARTPDLLAASQTLSQLSYSPKFVVVRHCNARRFPVNAGSRPQGSCFSSPPVRQ